MMMPADNAPAPDRFRDAFWRRQTRLPDRQISFERVDYARSKRARRLYGFLRPESVR